MCEKLVALFRKGGSTCVTLSLDDFYLPDEGQTHEHEDPRLRGRGNPGTHDVALLSSCLERLINFKGTVELPIYNKAAHSGRGDRSSFVRCVCERPDFILLEGWCVGFLPLPDHPDDAVNANWSQYVPIFDRLDTLVSLQGSRESCPAWRQQAEPDGGMTDKQLDAFTKRLFTTLDIYAPHRSANLVIKMDSEHDVVIEP